VFKDDLSYLISFIVFFSGGRGLYRMCVLFELIGW